MFCAVAPRLTICMFARGEGIPHPKVVFEKGDSEDLLRKHFKKHDLPDPEFAWSRSIIRDGRPQQFFVGLQAAGWVAWEYYVDSKRLFGLDDHDPTEEGRAPLRVFERLPGHVKIPYASAPLRDVAARVGKSFQSKVDGVRHATRRLTAIKANKQ